LRERTSKQGTEVTDIYGNSIRIQEFDI